MHRPRFVVLFLTALAAGLVLSVFAAQATGQTVLRVNFTSIPPGAPNFTGTNALQDALLAADTIVAGGGTVQVWVKSGTYKPGVARSATFALRNNVAILGGFNGTEMVVTARNPNANQAILFGDLAGDDVTTTPFGNRGDNAYHIVTAGPETNPTAVLDGFRIERGNADGTGADSRGGGIYVDGGSPTIRDFRIDACQAVFGGGIYIGGNGSPRFSGTPVNFGTLAPGALQNASVGFSRALTLRGGLGGGVFNESTGLVRFEQVDVRSNGTTNPESQSGGVHNTGRLIMARCIFIGNVGRFSSTEFYGGAIDNRGATARADIVGCWFIANSGRGVGAASSVGGLLNLHNCLLVNNFSNNGGAGGVYASAATLNVTNCTLFRNNCNTTAFAGGVTVAAGSIAALSNSILWGNTAGSTTVGPLTSVRALGNGTFSLNSCTVEAFTGPYVGTGLDTADPGYANPAGNDNALGSLDDNFRLPPGSPCINSGDNLRIPLDFADVDSNGDTVEPLPIDFYGAPRVINDFTGPTSDALNPRIDRGCAEANTMSALWIGASGSGGGIFDRADDWQNAFLPGPQTPAIFNQSAGGGSGNNVSLAYTMTLGSSRQAFLMSVTANRPTLNLRSGTSNGDLTLTAPLNSPEPALVVSRTDPVGFTPRLTLDNTAGPLTRRRLTASNATIARDLGSRGEIFVVSRRAELVINGVTEIGRLGAGAAVVQQQGLFTTQTLRLAVQPASTATLTVGGEPNNTQAASVTYGGTGTELVIGDRGSAIVTLGAESTPLQPRAPGRLEAGAGPADRVVIGRTVSGQGTLTLSGLGSEFVAEANDFILGQSGRATLTLTDRARLTSFTAGNVVMAQNAGSVATVTLGPGTVWEELTQGIAIGSLGQATVEIGDGALLAAAGPIRIAPSAIITGTGSIRGNVINVGRVRPGRSPGTLTIDGEYDQVSADITSADSGLLEMEVNDLTPGSFDRLLVTGEARLGGGVIVTTNAAAFPPIPAAGLDIPLIEAAGGLATGSNNTPLRFDVAFLPALTGPDSNKFLKVAYGGPEGTAGIVRLLSGSLGSSISAGTPTNTGSTGTPSSVAAADLDQDGLVDLALTIPAENAMVILMNRGVTGGQWQGFAGAVQFPVGINPQDISAGDIDGDGRADLAVANRDSNTVSLFRNTTVPSSHVAGFNAQGTLATGPTPSGVLIQNFDGSGSRPTIVTADETDSAVSILIRSSAPGFTFLPRTRRPVPSATPPRQPRHLDTDGDGAHPDLALLSASGDAVLILQNTSVGMGNVNFADAVVLPVGRSPAELRVANLRDGRPSLVTVNRLGNSVSVLVNTADLQNPTRFAPAVDIPAGIDPRSIASTDFDQDGDADLAVVTDSGTGGASAVRVRLFRNDYITDGQINEQVTLVNVQDLADPDAPDDPLFVVAGPLVSPTASDLVTLTGAGGLRGPGGMGVESGNVRPRLNTSIAPAPTCRIDFNNDGIVSPDDLDEFITIYFNDPPQNAPADFNNDGIVSPDDLDEFITLYFDGC